MKYNRPTALLLSAFYRGSLQGEIRSTETTGNASSSQKDLVLSSDWLLLNPILVSLAVVGRRHQEAERCVGRIPLDHADPSPLSEYPGDDRPKMLTGIQI